MAFNVIFWLDLWLNSRWSCILGLGLYSWHLLPINHFRLRWFLLFLLFTSLLLSEHSLLELFGIAQSIAFELILKILFHLLLGFVIESFNLFYFIDIENIIISDLLKEFQKEGSLGLSSPLSYPFVQVGVEVCLLHHLTYNVSRTNV